MKGTLHSSRPCACRNFLASSRLIFLFWLLVLADAASKSWALNAFRLRQLPIKWTGFLNIICVQNKGVSFGVFHNAPAWMHGVLSAVSIFLMIFLGYLYRKASSVLERCCLIFVLAGALGNLIDRLRWGGVIDFIDVHLLGWHFPTFNLADTWISLGGIGLIVTWALLSSNEK